MRRGWKKDKYLLQLSSLPLLPPDLTDASDAPRKEQIDGDNLLLDINSFKDAE